MQSYPAPRPTPGYQQPYIQPPPSGYKAPQPVEVYVLNDHANSSIPQDIREQFQRDEKGRVLFFTAPPLNLENSLGKDGIRLGHSARYLAARAKKDAMREAKRKSEEVTIEERELAAKKCKVDEEEKFKAAVQNLGRQAIRALEDQLAATTKAVFVKNEKRMISVLNGLEEQQKLALQVQWEKNAHEKERRAKGRIVVRVGACAMG